MKILPPANLFILMCRHICHAPLTVGNIPAHTWSVRHRSFLPPRGSRRAVPIACGGLVTAQAVAGQEYHYQGSWRSDRTDMSVFHLRLSLAGSDPDHRGEMKVAHPVFLM